MVAEVADIRSLVRRCLAGEPVYEHDDDRAQFVGTLFRRHRRSLLWHLMRLMPNRDDVEEVAQEAFVRLLGAARLETDANRARNYLFRTATNLARDNYRRKMARSERSHVGLDELPLVADDPPIEGVVDAERGARAVYAALRDLRPRPRKAFLLYVGEEMTYNRIAAELGVSKKTVERDIALTLALCRSRLAAWKDD